MCDFGAHGFNVKSVSRKGCCSKFYLKLCLGKTFFQRQSMQHGFISPIICRLQIVKAYDSDAIKKNTMIIYRFLILRGPWNHCSAGQIHKRPCLTFTTALKDRTASTPLQTMMRTIGFLTNFYRISMSKNLYVMSGLFPKLLLLSSLRVGFTGLIAL